MYADDIPFERVKTAVVKMFSKEQWDHHSQESMRAGNVKITTMVLCY